MCAHFSYEYICHKIPKLVQKYVLWLWLSPIILTPNNIITFLKTHTCAATVHFHCHVTFCQNGTTRTEGILGPAVHNTQMAVTKYFYEFENF